MGESPRRHGGEPVRGHPGVRFELGEEGIGKQAPEGQPPEPKEGQEGGHPHHPPQDESVSSPGAPQKPRHTEEGPDPAFRPAESQQGPDQPKRQAPGEPGRVAVHATGNQQPDCDPESRGRGLQSRAGPGGRAHIQRPPAEKESGRDRTQPPTTGQKPQDDRGSEKERQGKPGGQEVRQEPPRAPSPRSPVQRGLENPSTATPSFQVQPSPCAQRAA